MKKKAVSKKMPPQQQQMPIPELNVQSNTNNMNIQQMQMPTNINVQQQQQIPVMTNMMPQQRNVRGGMYGYRGNEVAEDEEKTVYNDDEEIKEKVK